MENIAIVIVNYNNEKDTIECLNSISRLTIKNFNLSVVVVDNGSTSKFKINTNDIRVKLKVQELTILVNQKNIGFSGGNNLGIKHALKKNNDYILLLNNDTILDKNLIEELIKVFNSDEKIGIVVPKIYFAKGFEFHKDRYKKQDLGNVIWYAGGKIDLKNIIGYHKGVDEVDNGQYNRTEETDFATGCCMLVKKEVFKQIGLFDEKYFLYYEDSDFSERVKKLGFKIIYCPKAMLWHKNAGSAGGSGSLLQDYFITRNRLLFAMRYAQFRVKLSLLKESLKLLINGRLWQRKGVLDFYLQRFGKGSYLL